MSLEVNPGETFDDFSKRAAEYYASCMAAAVAVVETAATAMEQEKTLPGQCFEQSSLTDHKPRIDREAGILHRVHVMGMHSTHGYDYSIEAQEHASPRYEGMAVGIDHDYSGGPLTMDDTWGTIRGPIEVDADGTWADLHYNRRHTRTEQLLENIERGIGNVGLSAVTQRVVQRGKTVVSFTPVRLDIVVGAATTRSVFEQASAPEVEALKSEVAALRSEAAGLKSKFAEVSARYEQHVAPRSTIQQTIAKTVAGIDLEKFWQDK